MAGYSEGEASGFDAYAGYRNSEWCRVGLHRVAGQPVGLIVVAE